MKSLPHLLTLLCVLFSVSSFATHVRGGQILLKRIEGRTYEIKLQCYLNTESHVPFGGSNSDVLYIYGKNGFSKTIKIPEITISAGNAIYEVIDTVRGIALVEYAMPYTFPANDRYTIVYTESNRNEGILNFSHSVSTPFCIKTELLIDPMVGDVVGTPVFLQDKPVFYGTAGAPFTCSLGAYSHDGDQVFYRLVTPQASLYEPVMNFSIPSSLSINPLSGLITWTDGKFQSLNTAGEYGFAVELVTMRDGKMVNTTVRDFQIIMEDQEQSDINISFSAELGKYEDIYVDQTTTIKIFYEFAVIGEYGFEIDVASEGINFIQVETYDSVETEKKIKVAVIRVLPTNEVKRANPYILNLRAKLSNQFIHERDFSILLYTENVEPWHPWTPQQSENDQILLQAYPNPVADFLTFDIGLVSFDDIVVLSSDGKHCDMPVDIAQKRIDFRNAVPGLYLIKIPHLKSIKVLKK